MQKRGTRGGLKKSLPQLKKDMSKGTKRGLSTEKILIEIILAAVVIMIFLKIGVRIGSVEDLDQKILTEDIALYYSTLSGIPSSAAIYYQILQKVKVSVTDKIETVPETKFPIKTQTFSKNIFYQYPRTSEFIESKNIILNKNQNSIYMGPPIPLKKSCNYNKEFFLKSVSVTAFSKEYADQANQLSNDVKILNFADQGIELSIIYKKSTDSFVSVRPGNKELEIIACYISNQLEIPLIFDDVKEILISTESLDSRSIVEALRFFTR